MSSSSARFSRFSGPCFCSPCSLTALLNPVDGDQDDDGGRVPAQQLQHHRVPIPGQWAAGCCSTYAVHTQTTVASEVANDPSRVASGLYLRERGQSRVLSHLGLMQRPADSSWLSPTGGAVARFFKFLCIDMLLFHDNIMLFDKDNNIPTCASRFNIKSWYRV